ncbi:YigZ family protein, partial [Campylobacter jejuni]|nr:YigZ family protein [Campylobacter jejuni]
MDFSFYKYNFKQKKAKMQTIDQIFQTQIDIKKS